MRQTAFFIQFLLRKLKETKKLLRLRLGLGLAQHELAALMSMEAPHKDTNTAFD